MLRSFVLVSVMLLNALLPLRSRAEPPRPATSPTPAGAHALPYETTLQIGRPLHPVRVSLQTGAELGLVIAGKRRTLPAPNASEVTVELLPVADGAVAVLRVRADNGAWVGIVGGRSGAELLLFERAEPVGDPGERHTREVSVGGEPKILRTGIRYEGVSLCGQRPAWFETKRLDETSLTLVADDAPLAPGTKSEEARVTPLSAPGAQPVLAGLAPIASSELDPGTLFPRAPRALVDNDLAHGLPLRGGFALLRWEGGALPIESFELALHANTGRTIELSWLGDRELALHASVSVPRGDARVSIVPPRALEGRCLALLLPKADGVELRELHAFTDLDREGGLDRLVGTVVQDDPRASAAVDLLEKLGPVAAERLALRWDELSVRGQRRGLKVLAHALARDAVRQRVLSTAQGSDAELRTAALAVLERGGEPGRVGLRELAQLDTPAGDLAARALAAYPEEAASLLAALSRDGGPARASLRAALTTLASKDAARTHEAATAWLASAPSIAARAALALAVARANDRDFAASLLEGPSLQAASSFEERYRVALALAGATPSPESDAWLRAQAESAEEWMQRSTAFTALVQRASSVTPSVGDKLAHDPYPRVRAEALAPLSAAGQQGIVEGLLASDPWPLVRVEAARALAPSAARRAESRSALTTAIADRAPRVRRAAIEALTAARQSAAWPSVQARVDKADETLEVRTAGLLYVRELCLRAAAPSLVKIARQVLSPSATDDDTQLAVEALRVLHDLGGDAAREGKAVIDKEGGPELPKLWDRLQPARCEPVAVPAPATPRS